jgi:hypothetical protein
MTVDAYLAGLGGERRERVAAVVAAARATGAVEAIEYGMPVFRKGDAMFGVANRAGYVSLYFDGRDDLVQRVIAGDPKLKHGKGCVTVTDARPMPVAAVEGALGELFGQTPTRP